MHRSTLAAALVAALLAGVCGCFVVESSDVYYEDYWEDNDSFSQADANADLSAHAGSRLTELDPDSAYATVNYLDDEDYFKITVPAGSPRVLVYCEFEHYYGDIDLDLFDEFGTRLDLSYSTDDDEHVDYNFGGTPPAADTVLYVRVTLYSGTENTYDLWWNCEPAVDPYEPNDDNTQAETALDEATWLSLDSDFASGWPGASPADEDWYEIVVASDEDTVEVWCDFYHVFGDVDVWLYDSALNRVDSSEGTADGEHILKSGLAPDTYYVVVGSYSPNVYDLWVESR